MKYLVPIGAALFLAAPPAMATGTISCRSTLSPTDGPQLQLTVRQGSTSGISQARLTQGNESFTTGQGAAAPVLAQSWLDRNSLRLEILDASGENVIARLETWRRTGWSYFGTLRYGGRTWRVRCAGEG